MVDNVAVSNKANWSLRLAEDPDVSAIAALIPISARALQAPFYSPDQIDAALGPVFAVDRQLIRDRTYFVVEADGVVVGCGGWSRRGSLFGGDEGRGDEGPLLHPVADAARVRAFFVHPGWARRGIASAIMAACERAIIEAGFRRVEIVATLAGEPLYRRFGYEVRERFELPLQGGLVLPVVRMGRTVP
jgi:GNAT superfamily N-acetyltransferase